MRFIAFIMGIFLTACAGEGMRPDDFVPGDIVDTTVDSDQRGGYEKDSDTADTGFETGLIPDSDTDETDSGDSDTADSDTGSTSDSDDSDALDTDTDFEDSDDTDVHVDTDVVIDPRWPMLGATMLPQSRIVVADSVHEYVHQERVVAGDDSVRLRSLQVEFSSQAAAERMVEFVTVELTGSDGSWSPHSRSVSGGSAVVDFTGLNIVVHPDEYIDIAVFLDTAHHVSTGLGTGVSGDSLSVRIVAVFDSLATADSYVLEGGFGNEVYYYETEISFVKSVLSPVVATPGNDVEILRFVGGADPNGDVGLSEFGFDLFVFEQTGWSSCSNLRAGDFRIRDNTGRALSALVTLMKSRNQPCSASDTSPVAHVVIQLMGNEVVPRSSAVTWGIHVDAPNASGNAQDVVVMQLVRAVWNDGHENVDSFMVPTGGVGEVEAVVRFH